MSSKLVSSLRCWNSGSCASMRNAPDTEFKVHSLLLLFSRAFYVYPLLFRSLQYIYESLYCSYPSVCLCRLQRQPESYSLSCSDHANNLRSLIRFQQFMPRNWTCPSCKSNSTKHRDSKRLFMKKKISENISMGKTYYLY